MNDGGIGAQDGDRVHMHFGQSEADTIVGWVVTEARKEAAWHRRRAFDRIPSYATLTPAGNHPPLGATAEERLLGCPAWPL